jgi:hypothetical protein
MPPKNKSRWAHIRLHHLDFNIPAIIPITKDITSNKILMPIVTIVIKNFDKASDKSSFFIHTRPFKKSIQGSAFQNHLTFNQVSDGYELFALVFCKAIPTVARKVIRG